MLLNNMGFVKIIIKIFIAVHSPVICQQWQINTRILTGPYYFFINSVVYYN
jgi:hypothetical protein